MSSQSKTNTSAAGAGGGGSSSSSSSSRSDEKQLFRHRARLFTMNTAGQWSELGTGDAKILLHGATNRTRLVMRKDKTMTIILNQLIQPEAILVNAKSQENTSTDNGGSGNTNGRAFVFEAEDFATGVTKKETFAIRFKVEEVASEFQRVYTEAQERNRVVFALEAASVRQQQQQQSSSSSSTAVSNKSTANTVTTPSSTANGTTPSTDTSVSSSSSSTSVASSKSVPTPFTSRTNAAPSTVQPTIHEDPNENNNDDDDDDDAKTATSTLTEDETPVPPNSSVSSNSSVTVVNIVSPPPSATTTTKTVTFRDESVNVSPSSSSSTTTAPTSTSVSPSVPSSSSGSSVWLTAGIVIGVTAVALFWADKQGHIQLKPILNDAKKSFEKFTQALKESTTTTVKK